MKLIELPHFIVDAIEEQAPEIIDGSTYASARAFSDDDPNKYIYLITTDGATYYVEGYVERSSDSSTATVYKLTPCRASKEVPVIQHPLKTNHVQDLYTIMAPVTDRIVHSLDSDCTNHSCRAHKGSARYKWDTALNSWVHESYHPL